MILVRCINGFYELQKGFLGIRTTFEALLARAVLIIPQWVLKLWGIIKNFIGKSVINSATFSVWCRKIFGSLVQPFYLLIFGLSWLNFRLRELLFCTKICTKASSLVLLQFYFGSTLVP